MMAGLGKFLLGVAGYMTLILLLGWLGAQAARLREPRAGRPRPQDFWDD